MILQHRDRRATIRDLLAIPEDLRFHELLDGELVEKAMPSFEHGSAQASTVGFLRSFNRKPGGSDPGGWWLATEVEIELGERVVPRPDIVGWRRERVPQRPTGTPVTIRPDWICEIVSPRNASRDTVAKMRLYHRCEIPHYWILSPQDLTLTVYRWSKDGYIAALTAERGDRVRAEPFEAIELAVGMLFGDEEDET